MSWPLSQDYNEAIQSPESSFSDPELRTGEAATNALGIPMPRSGNFADVYEVKCPNGSRWAVKCFTREVPGLRERYAEISRCLKAAKLPFSVDFTYLEQGMRIRGEWFPILKMQWVEGFTFNEFVRQYLDKPAMLEGLVQIWARMAQRLREASVAHADLQHGNVLLVPGKTANAVGVKLIDYDGMYVPALAGKKSGEVGHPSYQHPQRLREGTYSLEVDRFPLLLIAAALRCIKVGGRALWEKYDNGDNMLFREADLRAPQTSPLFSELERMSNAAAQGLVGHVRRALSAPLEAAPLLEEVLPELRAAAVQTARTPRAPQAPITMQRPRTPAPPILVAAPFEAPTAPWTQTPDAGAAADSSFAFDDRQTTINSEEHTPLTRRSSRSGGALVLGAVGGAVAVLCVGLGVWALMGRAPERAEEAKQAQARPKNDVVKPLPVEGQPLAPRKDRDGPNNIVPPARDKEEPKDVAIPAKDQAAPKDGGRPEPAKPPMLDDAWVKMVAALPPEKQVNAVVDKLRERNPGYDGKAEHKIENGIVIELSFLTDNVTDIAPVRALTGLRGFQCSGSYPNKGRLADLSPLKDMKLTTLSCDRTQVSDLSPLKDMKLTSLACWRTPIADLSPLKDMKLTRLSCELTQVSDLSPLKDMNLTDLACDMTHVSDLSPLKNMKLTSLLCGGTQVSDLSPLKDMKLTRLIFTGAPVSDLSPLKDMKLTTLWCNGTKVTDLSLLRSMPLLEIYCDFKPERDAEILCSIKTLVSINQKPAAEFWKDVAVKPREDGGKLDPLKPPPLDDAWFKQVAGLPAEKQAEAVAAKLKECNPGFDGKLTPMIYNGVLREVMFSSFHVTDLTPVRAFPHLHSLQCPSQGGNGKGKLADLSPLKGMQLSALVCLNNHVSDLSPLKDMPLTWLNCRYTKVSDLSPLRNTKLTLLDIDATPVADLAPLKDMKLTTLKCRSTQVSDLTPLKGMNLTFLDCSDTQVSDLSMLRTMPLTRLNCDFKPERDAAILRSIKTLQWINNKRAEDFWKDVDAKP
jgi:Leucine-rich repeat (LRR) protein